MGLEAVSFRGTLLPTPQHQEMTNNTARHAAGRTTRAPPENGQTPVQPALSISFTPGFDLVRHRPLGQPPRHTCLPFLVQPEANAARRDAQRGEGFTPSIGCAQHAIIVQVRQFAKKAPLATVVVDSSYVCSW